MPFGSSACLICLVTQIPASPTISSKRSLLPVPTPCSPVQVPPKAMARLPIRMESSLHFLNSPSSCAARGSGSCHLQHDQRSDLKVTQDKKIKGLFCGKNGAANV